MQPLEVGHHRIIELKFFTGQIIISHVFFFLFFFSMITVINLVHYRPSVIAAAAILATFDETLSQNLVEFKMRTVSLCGSLETVSFDF